MKKLFLQFLILSNLTFCSLISMQDFQQIKQITIGNNILFVDDTNLKVWKEEALLENVVELVEAPNKKFAIAIVVNDLKIYQQILVYLINYEKINNYKPFSNILLGYENGIYKKNSCQISQDNQYVSIEIDGHISSFINNI